MDIKYTTDGKKVVVIGNLNSQEKIVQEIFIVGGNEIPSGENFIVKTLHDGPAVNWNRDIGYGVPATCDFPGCNEEIDRGLAYVCGSEPCGGDRGCGLYFCHKHLDYHVRLKIELCPRCAKSRPPYKPKPDHPEWVKFKLSDKSWKEWRKKNPEEVKKMKTLQLNRGE